MSSTITGMVPREAGGEAGRDIVQRYKTHVQAQGYSPGMAGKCIRTILHLRHVVVVERDQDRNARHSRPASLSEP